jgi:hypothetical protein
MRHTSCRDVMQQQRADLIPHRGRVIQENQRIDVQHGRNQYQIQVFIGRRDNAPTSKRLVKADYPICEKGSLTCAATAFA